MPGGLVLFEGAGRVPAHVARKAEQVARAHGAQFRRRNIPGEGWRYWFVLPDGGSTANRVMERAIRSGLAAAGLNIRRLA